MRPTTFRPAYSNPLWSSDGTTLFFNHIPLDSVYEYPPGSGQILQAFNHDLEGFWSVDTSGQIMRRIYGQGLDSPVLSRDGTSVLYSAGGQIWRTAFAGDSLDPGSTTKMTNSTDGAFNPSLSWNGDRLLYDVGLGTNPGVYICSAAGGPARRVGDPGWYYPDWMPGDTAFAFVGYWPQVTGIGAADTNGISRTLLRTEAIYPRASPDGLRIAFLSHPSLGGGNQLWVMNRDGSQAQQLTTEGSMAGFSWSPDGRQIAYVRFDAVDHSYVNGTIWIIDLATLQKRQVTFNTPP